jgi:heme-degrading monooxygenase HmoA
MYISITGLELQSPWKLLIFYSHAIPSLLQAQSSEGNVSVEVRNINGVKHTLSVWESEEHMRNFIYSGAHKKAIEAFTKIAKGKTFGYDSNEVPNWKQVHNMWLSEGQNYKLN